MVIGTVLAIPAIYQIGLLLYAIIFRVPYPYDLEWMEGGLLIHGQRLSEGSSIYPEPSVEFIPYLYTPLYPTVLAMGGYLVDITYQLGRLISVASLLFLSWQIRKDLTWRIAPEERPLANLGWFCGLGVIAAAYPYMEGWYDLVRADTLFCAMAFTGLFLLRRWAQLRAYERGDLRMTIATMLIAMSFFCKQTGVLFTIMGGVLLLFYNYKRLPMYILISGIIGLGGTLLMNLATDGWFWTYVFEVHQQHDFNADRFWLSFHNMLFKFPLLTYLLGAVLVFSFTTAVTFSRSKQSQRTLFSWAAILTFCCLLGAIGWGTEFAHFNAYMPMFIALGGATAASIAALYQTTRFWKVRVESLLAKRLFLRSTFLTAFSLGALVTCDALTATNFVRQDNHFIYLLPASMLGGGFILPMISKYLCALPREYARRVPFTIPLIAAAIIAGQLSLSTWNPKDFIPTDKDVDAGDNLINTIQSYDGEVWIPWHPWYAEKAGKPSYVHRMGLVDVQLKRTYFSIERHWKLTIVKSPGLTKIFGPPQNIPETKTSRSWQVAELAARLREQRFSAIILDRKPGVEFGPLLTHYKLKQKLPTSSQPKVYSGAKSAVPKYIYVPKEDVNVFSR